MARPREFDMDEALDAAMETFWTHGYKATSMTDLTKAMGLKKGSIYQAFGDKHSLFLKAFQRYTNNFYKAVKDVFAESPSPTAGMERFIEELLFDAATDQKICRGCFFVNALVELASHDPDVGQIVKGGREALETLFESVIKEGQDLGEFDKSHKASEMAATVSIFMYGIMADYKSSTCKDRAARLASHMMETLKA